MYQRVKGTYDVTPTEGRAWRELENQLHQIMSRYHIDYVRTPIFEYKDVFHRQDEHSDMVTKETYNFKDRSDRELTLRPEGTAGVIRSIVENKLYVPGHTLKVYYLGANYRYERPQKGRYREFYQVGVEVIGDPTPIIDAEVITLAYELIKQLRIQGAVVKINHLGSSITRKQYQSALIHYLTPLKDQLSSESQARLSLNPLRILDSKSKTDQAILNDAPKLNAFLTDEDRHYMQSVLSILDQSNIPYEINDQLVRGLDYYSQVVFEIQSNLEGFGAQNALGGGGRYDHLVKELGGHDVSGIGFAFGMERLLIAQSLSHSEQHISHSLDAFIITLGKESTIHAYLLMDRMRRQGLNVSMDYQVKSMKSQLKQALDFRSKFAILLGSDEISNQEVTVKNLQTEQQITMKETELFTYLSSQLGVLS
jgi:histidyl-tRNA synthetase